MLYTNELFDALRLACNKVLDSTRGPLWVISGRSVVYQPNVCFRVNTVEKLLARKTTIAVHGTTIGFSESQESKLLFGHFRGSSGGYQGVFTRAIFTQKL